MTSEGNARRVIGACPETGAPGQGFQRSPSRAKLRHDWERSDRDVDVEEERDQQGALRRRRWANLVLSARAVEDQRRAALGAIQMLVGAASRGGPPLRFLPRSPSGESMPVRGVLEREALKRWPLARTLSFRIARSHMR